MEMEDFLFGLSIVTALLSFASPGMAMFFARSTVRYAPYPYLFALVNCVLWICYGAQHDLDAMRHLNVIGALAYTTYSLIFFWRCSDDDVRQVYLLRLIYAGVGVLAVAFLVNAFVSKGVYDILCSLVAVCVSGAPFWNTPKVLATKTMESMPSPLVPAVALLNAVIWTIRNTLGVQADKINLHVLIPCGFAVFFALVQVLMHLAFWMWPAAAASGNDNQDQQDTLRKPLIDKTEKGTASDELEEGTGGQDASSLVHLGKDEFWVEVASSEDENVDDAVKNGNVLGGKTDTDALHAAYDKDKLRLAALDEEEEVVNIAPAVITKARAENKDELLTSRAPSVGKDEELIKRGQAGSPNALQAVHEEVTTNDKDKLSLAKMVGDKKLVVNVAPAVISKARAENKDELPQSRVPSVGKDEELIKRGEGSSNALQAAHDDVAAIDKDKLSLATLAEEKKVGVVKVTPSVISEARAENKDELPMPRAPSVGKDEEVIKRGEPGSPNALQAAHDEVAAIDKDKLSLAMLAEEKQKVGVVNVTPSVISDAGAANKDKLPTSRPPSVGKDEELIKGGKGSTDA